MLWSRLPVLGRTKVTTGRRFCVSSASSGLITVSEEVRAALNSGGPVVALETAIVSHGMPYPQNISTALRVEDVVRKAGALPATIGVIRGQPKIGLSSEEIKDLGRPPEAGHVAKVKVSSRDLGWVTAQGLSGGTTVAATILLAARAGIPIFVTGGLGGVHRGASESFDISNDLTVLGRHRTAVVCAGVKSILDIPKTLEVLETEGVCVSTYQTADRAFPNFFTRDSGYKASYNVNDPKEAALLISRHFSHGPGSGIVIAVPIPQNDEAYDVEDAVSEALIEAESLEITGKELTPFILSMVAKKTSGASLKANIALIQHNAKIGAEIAKAYSRQLEKNAKGYSRQLETKSEKQAVIKNPVQLHPSSNSVVFVGAMLTDTTVKLDNPGLPHPGLTNSAKILEIPGGVARNIAEAFDKAVTSVPTLSQSLPVPLFLSVIGNDSAGRYLTGHSMWRDAAKLFARVRVHPTLPTGRYMGILTHDGEYLYGIGDTEVSDCFNFVEDILPHEATIRSASIVVLDADFPQDAIEQVLQLCKESDVPVFFDPTEPLKSCKPFQSDAWKTITIIKPNIWELVKIHATLTGDNEISSDVLEFMKEPRNTDELVSLCRDLSKPLIPTIPKILITLGEKGILLISNPNSVQHYSTADSVEKIASVNGAGDSLSAGYIIGYLQRCSDLHSVSLGMEMARQSLLSVANVCEAFDSDRLQQVLDGKRLVTCRTHLFD